MADVVTTNMNLTVPTVSTTVGPTYATEINADFSLIDSHDHSNGKGVPVPVAGLSITTDFPIANNNLTQARSIRFTTNAAPLANPADISCGYFSGVDFYVNDASGNQIRITQSGGVAGTPGSITSLAAPASATYVSGNQTFVWQSAANTPANLDAGSVIFRNISASSFGMTMNPPAAMAANFAVTWPTLPGSTKFLTITSAGAIAVDTDVDNTTLQIVSSASSKVIGVKPAGIGGTQLAAVSIQTSGNSGSFNNNTATYLDVTNLSVTITTIGRPVKVYLQSDSGVGKIFAQGGNMYMRLMRDKVGTAGSVSVGESQIEFSNDGSIIPSAFTITDAVAAGTYGYKFQVKEGNGVTNARVINCVLCAYEVF